MCLSNRYPKVHYVQTQLLLFPAVTFTGTIGNETLVVPTPLLLQLVSVSVKPLRTVVAGSACVVSLFGEEKPWWINLVLCRNFVCFPPHPKTEHTRCNVHAFDVFKQFKQLKHSFIALAYSNLTVGFLPLNSYTKTRYDCLCTLYMSNHM